MDRLERINDGTASLIEALTGWQAGIWTAMPGTLVSFDPADTTCSVQVMIQMQVQQADGTQRWETIKPLIKCPVVLPGGGGCVITLPLKPGDEVLVVFAARCIDSWWQSGQIGPQVELRLHDLSDGFAIPGPRSVPKAITNYNGDAIEIRNEAGTLAVTIDPVASMIAMKGNVIIQGNLAVTGTMTNNGTNVGSTHRHGNVSNGPSQTGTPT